MSETTRAPSSTRPEPLSLVWRFFAAPPTLLILTALVALALILSQVVPQIPAEIDDPRAWLAVQPGVLGGNGLLQALGLFDVLHAPWFRVLLALTALCLFVWAVESAEIAWRAARGRWTHAELALWGRHPMRVRVQAGRGPEASLIDARAFLLRQRYRCADVAGAHSPSIVAGRHAAGWWAQPAAVAGLLLALLGVAIVVTWGWQGREWRPAAGERWVVGHNTNAYIQLDGFGPSRPGGQGAGGYESRVTWLENDRAARQARVAAGRPASWHGLTLRQIGTAPAVTVRGTDAAGQALLFQAADEVASPAREITLAFESPDAQHLVLLPNQNLFLLVSLEPNPAGESGLPALKVARLGSSESEQETLGVLNGSGTVQAQGLAIQLDVALRPVLRVDHRPGMALIFGGMAAAVLALAAGWLASPALLWLAAAPGVDGPASVQLLSLGGTGQGPRLARLAAQLREALAGGD